jgi:hypothetical protein
MRTTPGIKAFAAAIIGGLDNPIGILIGGLEPIRKLLEWNESDVIPC